MRAPQWRTTVSPQSQPRAEAEAAKPHMRSASAPSMALINPETLAVSAVATVGLFAAWVATHAWCSGATGSSTEFFAFVKQLLIVQPGWLETDRLKTLELAKFTQLFDLRSIINLCFGILLVNQLEHFLRNLFVGSLWLVSYLEVPLLVELFKVVLLFFPRISHRKFHNNERIGLITSSVKANTFHSVKGFDSFVRSRALPYQ